MMASMVRSVSESDARRMRMRSQNLCTRAAASVHDVVQSVFAIQAQDTRAARLAVRARTPGLDSAAVDRACNEERSVIRIWAMRSTLHMVAAEDAAWIVGFLGPRFVAAGRSRRLALGLDDALCERALKALEEVLGDRGPLTRSDLIRQIAARGITIDSKTQAPAHLVSYAALRGLICRGPDVEHDEPTFVLMERSVRGGLLDADQALAELARRYLAAYAPATPEDFAAWCGVPLGEGRRGFELVSGELEELRLAGQPAWTLGGSPDAEAEDAPCVRLLGRFDSYLLGYRSRDFAVNRRFAKRIQAGGGIIRAAVVVDGRVLGTWRQERGRDSLVIEVEQFEQLGDHAVKLLAAEAVDIGRFLGATASLVLTP